MSVGDSIRVVGSVYDLIALILTVDSGTLVTLDTPFISTDTGHLNRLTERSDYSVQIDIFDSAGTTKLIDDTFIFKPAQNGDLFIDLGTIVVTIMENLSVEFIEYLIKFDEVFTGSTPAVVTDVVILAILGQKSIGQRGGSNLVENILLEINVPTTILGSSPPNYRFIINVSEGDVTSVFSVGQLVRFDAPLKSLATGELLDINRIYKIIASNFDATNTFFNINEPFVTGAGAVTTTILQMGRFLTKFKTPKLWKGFINQTLSSIMDSNFGARTGLTIAQFNQRSTDINKVLTVGSQNNSFNTTQIGIITQALTIFTGATDKFTRLQMLGDAGEQIGEQIFFKYQEPCPNPIMVEWVNSLGASEFYLFEVSQSVTLGATEGLLFQLPFDEDVSNITRHNRRTDSKEALEITCFAEELTADDVRALHELKTAEKIEVWLTDDGLQKIGATVESSFTTSYETESVLNRFVVTLLFPTDFNFFDLKQY